MGFVVGNFGSLSKKEATPVAAVSVHALPPLPQQASSLPNWMPVSAENGTGSVTLVAMARVTSLRVVMTNEVGSRTGLKNGGGRGSIRCRREKGVFLDRCRYCCVVFVDMVNSSYCMSCLLNWGSFLVKWFSL